MNNANVTTVKSKPSVEQDRVINAPTNQDVLIVAGAGSGKTYTMTRRVIQLIQSSVAPESILGLTFTNKAAAELLSRVSAEVSASGAKSFLKPEVMTYDAFFQSIVRRYGLLVGFNQNTMPLSDAGAMEIIKSIIGKYLDNPQNHNKNLNKLYDFDTLCSDVMKLCAEISCSMIGVDAQGNTCSSVPQAVQKIREWNNEFAEHLKNVIGNKKVESPLPAKSPAIPKYRKVKKTAGMSAEDVTKISAEKFKQACKKYEKYWDDSCLQLCVNLYNSCVKRDILLDLVLQFDAEKKRVNMAQFSDFTIAAYYLVTHFPSICAQYKNQYSQVLLDEYQDTSTTQAMLINTLFHAENDGDNDGDFASSKRTHVMAVGDPFQAIYSFRGASTGAFCKFEQDFNINEQNKYSLTVTRRNSLFILKVANALTEPMRGENGDNSTQNASRRFSSIDDREVQVETLKPKEDASNGTIAALFMPSQAEEIDAVVRFAKKIVEKYGENPLEPQLAILFRSKANMPKYAEKLESAGIRTSIVGYSSLIEKPAVKDVLSLLKVVQDHSDSNSLMRLLATPRFALSTDDLGALAAIANSANTEYLYNIYSSAGLLEADLPKSQWDSAVRNLRNKANSGEISGQVINIYGGVYLADLIMRDFSTKNDQWVNQMQQKLSIGGFDAVKRLSKILHNVEGIQRNSLTNVMQAAVQALNVDIDTAVGSALKYKDFSNQIMLDDMRSVLDSLNAIVETYIQEMGEWQDVSLRGLISWIDSAKNLDSQSGSSVSSSSQTEPAQVVLMTVHQSKGLQWPAVAVVGLNEGAFPSNQGDSLKVDDNGQASARIPIEFGASVPCALRVDANILPHFPHTVTRAEAMHPEKAMQSLDSVQKIFDEIKPDRIKALCDFAEAVKEVDSCDSSDSGDFLSEETRRVYNAYKSQQNVDSMPFTQSEERGIQLHMDERHLMYVALTRAKFAALLTGSATSGDSAQSGRKRSASVFLNESINAIKNLNGAIKVQRCDSNEENKTESKESEEYEEQDVFGFIAGDDAQEFAAEFSKIAPQSDSSSLEPTLKWPCTLSSTIEKSLIESAKLVENCDSDLESVYDSSINTNPKSLLYKAKIFIQDADLTSQNDCDYSLEELAEKVNKISSGSRLNVTSLQKISKIAQNAKTSVYNNLLACIRPIPSIPSIDANLGTKFHAWAQQFVDSATPSESCECYEWKNIVKHGISLEKTPENRQKVIDDFNQSCKDSDSQSCALNQWKQRLIESRWAKRVPLAAEMPILMQIDNTEFANRIINGTLDAVFAGGLDASDTTKLYTIVDWKTGKRPKSAEDIRLKLEQLDWYRMLLARATNVDLRCIDATLYYVSEARAENREIHALCKTRDEILSEASF